MSEKQGTMRKIDKKISQQGIKRYNKNKARQARNKSKLENHIKWLELMINANVELDFEKLWKKKGSGKSFMKIKKAIFNHA